MSLGFDNPVGFEAMVRSIADKDKRVLRIAFEIADLCFELDEMNTSDLQIMKSNILRSYYDHETTINLNSLWGHTKQLCDYVNGPSMERSSLPRRKLGHFLRCLIRILRESNVEVVRYDNAAEIPSSRIGPEHILPRHESMTYNCFAVDDYVITWTASAEDLVHCIRMLQERGILHGVQDKELSETISRVMKHPYTSQEEIYNKLRGRREPRTSRIVDQDVALVYLATLFGKSLSLEVAD